VPTFSHTGNYIDGEWADASSGRSIAIIDPATDETLTFVPASDSVDVDRAITSAARARDAWARTTPRERSEMLLEVADRLHRDLDAFARIESYDAGKPISTTGGEVGSAVDRLRFFAGAARCLEGRAAGEYAAGYTSMIRREPVGVAALITPWNYPLLTAVTKLSPALAAGNTVVLKPSEVTPLTALRFTALTEGVLPPGVLNVVSGTGTEAATALVTHPDVDLVSLTGGTATGKEVARAAAATVKRVHLELGGKAPAVVLDDADPAEVAPVLRAAAFWNAAQPPLSSSSPRPSMTRCSKRSSRRAPHSPSGTRGTQRPRWDRSAMRHTATGSSGSCPVHTTAT
jgi:acyl-CoA reductase-like NAD-dependent aldehyde dehydrogenase